MLSKQKFSELILQIINFVKDVKILNIGRQCRTGAKTTGRL
jgi:hypothetical protein